MGKLGHTSVNQNAEAAAGSGGRKRVGIIGKPTSLFVMAARICILVSED